MALQHPGPFWERFKLPLRISRVPNSIAEGAAPTAFMTVNSKNGASSKNKGQNFMR
jgi:uncharacterized protein (DUF885 family)